MALEYPTSYFHVEHAQIHKKVASIICCQHLTYIQDCPALKSIINDFIKDNMVIWLAPNTTQTPKKLTHTSCMRILYHLNHHKRAQGSQIKNDTA